MTAVIAIFLTQNSSGQGNFRLERKVTSVKKSKNDYQVSGLTQQYCALVLLGQRNAHSLCALRLFISSQAIFIFLNSNLYVQLNELDNTFDTNEVTLFLR